MKTRVLYFAMIAAALSFSCQKAELENDGAANGGTNNEVVDFVPGPGRILAVTPTGADTKITFGDAVDGKYPVVWTNGDAIKVYSETCTAGEDYTYTYVNENDPEDNGPVASAVFNGNVVGGQTRYAVYPNTRARELSEDGKLKVSFGALRKQEFHTSLDNNKGNLKFMPMWAKEEGNSGKFQFNNLCGAVSFKFNDYQELRDMQIVSVEISSKTKYISGCASFDPEAEKLELEFEAETEGKEALEKTVLATKNDEYNFIISSEADSPSINEEGVAGYIVALPVGTYEANDLTVTITDNFGRVFSREITTPLTVEPGVIKTFPTLTFTFCYGEANCHVLGSTAGASLTFDAAMRYDFGKSLAVDDMKLVKGTDSETFVGGDNYKVEAVWEKAEDANAVVPGSVLSSVDYADNRITVTAVGGRGNALVALYTTSGEGENIVKTILWSWHIWVAPVTPQTYSNCTDQGSPIFHDRNLGATTSGAGKQSSVGLYYQYGRKDPFVIKGEITPVEETPYLTTDVELTFRQERNVENARVSWTIKNPTTRIIYKVEDENFKSDPPTGFNDWIIPGAEVEKYWGNTAAKATTVAEVNAAKSGYKTIYDPCPKGYRVPDYYYTTGIANGASVTSVATAGLKLAKVEYDSGKYTYYYLPGTLNLRGEGVCNYNNRGYYWTSTLTPNRAAAYLYNTGTIHTNSLSNRTVVRSAACNIRCMKIQ